MSLVDSLSEIVVDLKNIKKHLSVNDEDLVLELVPMSRTRHTQEICLVDSVGNIFTSVQVMRNCTLENIKETIEEYRIGDLKNIPLVLNTNEQLN